MSKKIIWISSYPKCGNTYIRCFLCHYLFNKNSEFNFDVLAKIPKFETKDIFKRVLEEDIFNKKFIYYKYFLDVQKKLIKKYDQKELIFKTHHFFGELNNCIFTNDKTTLLFIYIIRDPREVLVSYAVHSGMSIDSILDFFVSGQIMRKAKMESIVNWDIHYRSWRSFKSVPSMFIKFEDLLQNPKKNFHLLINFLSKYIDIKLNEKLLDETVELTRFANLKKLESIYGFKESKENDFFNSGKIDSWKKLLNKRQVKLVEDKFYKEMKELGYIK